MSTSHTAATLPLGPTRRDQLLRQRMSAIRHKILVTSGKGGVGKSSVTVNLAVALADTGWTVGILDADLHGPSVPNLLGLDGRCDAAGPHEIRPLAYNERLRVLSMDVLLERRDDPVMWKGPHKAAAIRQFLADVAWDDLDVLLIDSPPGTGDEPMAVLAAIPDAWCLLVTTPQELSLADVRKAAAYLGKVQARILGLVENMSGLHCPHCGGEIDLFHSGGGADLAAERGIPFLGSIPVDPAAVVAADRGEPVCRMAGALAGEALRAVARTVAYLLEERRSEADEGSNG